MQDGRKDDFKKVPVSILNSNVHLSFLSVLQLLTISAEGDH